VLELLDDPIRLEGIRTHQHRQPRRSLNSGLDLTPQGIAPLELPRIDPHLLPQLRQLRQRLPQLPHKAVIGRAVGQKEMGQEPVIRMASG